MSLDALRAFRKRFFTKPRPSGRYFLADATVSDVTRALGAQSFAPNWEYSYNYRGEDVNLARVVYEEHRGVEWWQTHVRGWIADDGVELSAHWEPEPTEHPTAHLDGDACTVTRGEAELRAVLDAIEYTEFIWDETRSL